MMKLRLCAALTAAMFLCSACVASAPAAATSVQLLQSTPAPTATPEPLNTRSEEETLRLAQDVFFGAFGLSFELPEFSGETWGERMEEAGALRTLPEQLREAAGRAFFAVQAATGLKGAIRFETEDWKLLAVLAVTLPGDYETILKNAMRVEFSIEEELLLAEASLPELYRLIEKRQEGFFAVLSYAYLNTIYDDAGQEKEFEQYRLPEGYLGTLADPLPGARIKDGWYAPRQKATRKHTGTDIRAARNTPILSCSDGVVQYIGSSETAGNYVVVLDPQGFAYHYYHMVRLTDFLKPGDTIKKGDVVGHVGSTGNSVANHLHLTIVSPKYTYINPYPVLRDLRIQNGAA